MKKIVERTLDLWGMSGATCRLVAARENHVFRIDHKDMSYALRVHRSGYRSDSELRSELQWMGATSNAGLHVPIPKATLSGDFLQVVENNQVDVLSWLPGAPIGAAGEGLHVRDRVKLFHDIGVEMAKLHQISDEWKRPQQFTRPAWDRAGLIGEAPVWDRFWENPTLSRKDRDLFSEIRRVANAELSNCESDLDYGLVHADLVRENIIRDGERLQFIDFDDGGFGFRLFDLATTLIQNLYEADFSDLRSALIEGYRSKREIDTTLLNLFMVLRSTTYIGWIITRMHEDGSAARNERFVSRARLLANEYLAGNAS